MITTERDTLADLLGSMPEAYNVTDFTDEATTMIAVSVEVLADALLAAGVRTGEVEWCGCHGTQPFRPLRRSECPAHGEQTDATTPERCRWTRGGAPACQPGIRDERYWCEPCKTRVSA